MSNDLFLPFLLVGGISLSLQLGHRMSVDIDLFSDHEMTLLIFKRFNLI
ncbi:MAG: nucleotidyl transferase AbiEii/AbiGii toxin family protein [Parabacteroides gordonii]